MPVIDPSSYRPPAFLTNGHLQTVWPVFRKVQSIAYERERIQTPDGDFLDLDWSKAGANRIAVISHGLEGDSRRPYVRGMIRALRKRGWDALAWNYRGCSGECNLKLRSYHSGETGDLHTVLGHVTALDVYEHIVLIGFSLGGNVTLKYLGEQGAGVDSRIIKAIAISVPCHLKSGALKLAERSNWLYMKRFLFSLRRKIRAKVKLMPGEISDAGLNRIKTFMEFDDRYTAPIHGFKNADDYFERCSSRHFLSQIRVPTLLINARNDPFLAKQSFPFEEARANPFLFFEAPESGGHVGFVTLGQDGEYWSETRAMEFLE